MRNTQKGRDWKKPLLITLCVVVVLAVGLVAAGAAYWYRTIGLINQVQEPETTLSPEEQSEALEEILGETLDITEPTDPLVEDPEEYISNTPNIINILLIGQDSRGSHNSKLSDTMILCTINREEKTLVLTSFLRDLYVKMPSYGGSSYGANRLNVAYSLGWLYHGEGAGMEMLDQCLLENFGVQVDHNIEVDFVAFEQIVDLLGGVDIELTEREAYHLSYNNESGMVWSLQEGMNHLNGLQALEYARIRKLDSDFQRTNRQRNVITALLEQSRDMTFAEFDTLLKTVLPLLTTDMDSQQITEYAWAVLPLLPELQVVSQAIPQDTQYHFADVGTEDAPMSVIVPHLEEIREFLRQTIGG